MWRNREIRQQITAQSLILAALTAAVFFLDALCGLLVLAGSLAVILTELYFLRKRYRVIADLAEALRRICAGDSELDVRDNEEGECSILKSEIYKVTRILIEQGQLYKNDQERLADAIADISHQLKTPLTSLMLMADLLRRENLEAEQRQTFAARIQSQLQRMEWLLSSLLKMAKIDAGTAVFAQERVCMAELVRRAAEPVLIPMEIKNQTLRVEGDAEAGFTGDISWTTEAVVNVLKNCVEHTPEGGRLFVSYSENPMFSELVVEDNGGGIPKEDLPYIFQRFYRGKNAGKDSAGIGLAMAASIVRRQRGELLASSREGEGSTFRFRFYKQSI